MVNPILPKVLFAGRAAKRSWLKALSADFSAIAAGSPLMEALAGASMAEWRQFFAGSPRAAMRSVDKALAAPALNARHMWGPTRRAREAGMAFDCPDCGKAFASRQSAAVHRYRVHRWRHDARRLLDTTHCTVCLLELARGPGSSRTLWRNL